MNLFILFHHESALDKFSISYKTKLIMKRSPKSLKQIFKEFFGNFFGKFSENFLEFPQKMSSDVK